MPPYLSEWISSRSGLSPQEPAGAVIAVSAKGSQTGFTLIETKKGREMMKKARQLDPERFLRAYNQVEQNFESVGGSPLR